MDEVCVRVKQFLCVQVQQFQQSINVNAKKLDKVLTIEYNKARKTKDNTYRR